MEDSRIVELYWARSESAITETVSKYGKYCYSIAYNILANAEDADESVNDTYLGAWNSIPSHRPSILSSFLGKITRRLSIDKWRKRSADKRGCGEVPLVLEELQDCIPVEHDFEQTTQMSELEEVINRFVVALPKTEQKIFVCRYWYLDSILEISSHFGFSESKVKSVLYRVRKKLLSYLKKEGI